MLQLDEIGVFYSDAVYTQQAPRQGIFTNQSGVVKLKEKCNFEQALSGLENIRRIWLLWGFHHARNWKALVSPPHAAGGRKMLQIGANLVDIFRLPLGVVQMTLGAPFGFFGDGLSNIAKGAIAPVKMVGNILVLPFALFGVNL